MDHAATLAEAEVRSNSVGSPIRLDRNELAGAFGDIGTDLPLITGMILASGIHPASVLTVFGFMQILSALIYRMPMPVQPLKAVAALVIAERLTGPVIYGAGLAIGIAMLILTTTGLINWLARVIPKSVIRGIQFGLGAKLSLLALGSYIPSDGVAGYALAAVGFVVSLWLLGNRKCPPALLVIGIGVLYALLFKVDTNTLTSSFRFVLPQVQTVAVGDVVTGFLVLALPQIPLSLGNSIFATRQMANDFFPDRNVTARKIGTTYSIMNLVAPFFSGIPVCHGSGGLAGHYAFGGRTGGSVVLYGTFCVILGLFFSNGFAEIIQIFPLPILGIILLFEGLIMMRFIQGTVGSKSDLSTALLTGVIAVGLPYGFLVGTVVGTTVAHLSKKYHIGFNGS